MFNSPNGTTFEKTSPKRVSFIVTTRDRADYLKATLERLRSLRHPEDEVIVVDGFSKDHTADIVARNADLIDVFVSEPDLSGAHALNKGILIASGKYVKQLPDDDIIYPEAMEQAVGVLDEHPYVDLLVCGGTRVIGERESPVYLPPGYNYGKSVSDVFNYGACGTGFIFRRSCFALIGLLHPTDMIADQEIVLRAISRGACVKFCRINLFHHRIFEHSVTVSQRVAWDEDRKNLIKLYAPQKLYLTYRIKIWYSSIFIPWLLEHQILTSLARAMRGIWRTVTGRKPPGAQPGKGPTNRELLWDGGFS